MRCVKNRSMRWRVAVVLIPVLTGFSPSLQATGAERLVSLKPNITEILYELGLGEDLVGVTTFCDYPAAAQKKAKVGDYVHVNVEKVMSLKPTWVFASQENSLKKEIYFLQKQGIRVELFSFLRISDIFTSLEKMAELLGRTGQGHLLAQTMRNKLQNMEGALSRDGKKIKTLMLVGRSPLVVVGGDNLLNDVLHLVGLDNIAGGSAMRYPTYSIEQLILAQPAMIIDLSMESGALDKNKARQFYKNFISLPAVREHRVYMLDVADFRPSPRIVAGIQGMIDVIGRNDAIF